MNSDRQATPEQKELIETCYKRKYAAMLRVAHRMLSDPALAETAVQETFLVALRQPDKFSDAPDREAWLYAVLKNIIKHLRRDRALALKYAVSVDDVPEEKLSYEEPLPEPRLLDLTEGEDRRLLAYHYVYGYSVKELADKYGLSVGACKMRIKRARDRLREREKEK